MSTAGEQGDSLYQSEFDQITGGMRKDHEGKRIALILMFDELPGTTMEDLSDLVRKTVEANRNSDTMKNMTVTAARREQADEIEKLCQLQLNDE